MNEGTPGYLVGKIGAISIGQGTVCGNGFCYERHRLQNDAPGVAAPVNFYNNSINQNVHLVDNCGSAGLDH